MPEIVGLVLEKLLCEQQQQRKYMFDHCRLWYFEHPVARVHIS